MASPISRGIRLKALDPLCLSDEGDDCFDVGFAQTLNRWHWPEIPVVLDRTDLDGELKGSVGVMIWLVNTREMRGALIGPAEVLAVALRAIRRIQLTTAGDQSRVLWIDTRFAV